MKVSQAEEPEARGEIENSAEDAGALPSPSLLPVPPVSLLFCLVKWPEPTTIIAALL